MNQKDDFINQIIKLITEYTKSEILNDNPIIQDAYMMPHSELCLSPNFGAWWQKFLDNQTLQKAIDNKEKRLDEYKKTIEEVWLLIVIGGVDASSYQINSSELYEINSNFDKIFLMEDYYNNLYQLK